MEFFYDTKHRALSGSTKRPPIGVFAIFVIAAVLSWTMLNAVVASHFTGSDVTVVFRDRTAALGLSPFAGVFSNLGILAMASAASISVFAALLTDRDRGLLFAIGAFTTMIFLDDLLLLHEHVFPKVLGVPEAAILATYCALAAAIAFWFRSAIFRRENYGLAIAVAFLGASVAVDVVFDVVTPFFVVVEDGTKLIGLGLWSAFWISNALHAVRKDAA